MSLNELDGKIDELRRSGAAVCALDDVCDEPWRLDGVHVFGPAEDDAQAACFVLAAARGASITVAASEETAEALRSDLAKLGIAPVRPNTTLGPGAAVLPAAELPAEMRQLLLALAEGLSIPEAAARCYMSERTAHRRITGAERLLGVRSTAEAVVRVAQYND